MCASAPQLRAKKSKSQIHLNEDRLLTVKTCRLQEPSGLNGDYWMISRRTVMCLTNA